MNRLTTEQINEILDAFDQWLTHANVISIDLVEHPVSDSEVTYELEVGTLSDERAAEIRRLDQAAGVETRLLHVPSTASLPATRPLPGAHAAKQPMSFPTRVVTVEPILEEELVHTPLVEHGPSLEIRQRPCPGGVLIKTAGFAGRGSLATSLLYRGKYRILSNNHVISKNGSVGENVYQPAIESPENKLAQVDGFDRIEYYPTSQPLNPVYNTTDIAWCDSDVERSSQSVTEIGEVTGWRAPKLGEEVELFGGKTQERRTAKIKSITLRYRSQGSLGYSFWKNGIELDALVTQAGDSGTAYVASNDKRVVALHRSAGTTSKGAPL